jgi:hypothetical protein
VADTPYVLQSPGFQQLLPVVTTSLAALYKIDTARSSTFIPQTWNLISRVCMSETTEDNHQEHQAHQEHQEE